MKTLILAYENACKSLESRILQLREMMKAPDLPQRERDSLEQRRRLMVTEIREMRQSIEQMRGYLPEEGREFLAHEKESQVPSRGSRRFARYIAKNIIKNELSPRQKQILVLYYKEQKTMPEIAAALGITTSTVSRTRKRACTSIQKKLQSYGLY